MAFCRQCGKEMGVSAVCPSCGASASAASSSGVVAAPPPPPVKKKSRRGLMVMILLVFIVGMIGYMANLGSSVTQAKKDAATGGAAPVQCEKEAGTFMELMRENDSMVKYEWKPGAKPVTLYDVRKVDYKGGGPVLNKNMKPLNPPRVNHEFEVESSTKGGIPIVKRWSVQMEPATKNAAGSGNCAVVDLVSATP